MEKEIWKSLEKIVEHGENYEVSNLGNLRRIGKIESRKLVKDKDGYLTINLSKNGKVKSYKIHRLVALAFIPNENNKLEVNHKDSNRRNNVVANLEWVTNKENINHAKNKGSMIGNRAKSFEKWQGNKNGNAKLKDEDVIEIVKDWNTGIYTYTSLAEKHNMSLKAISAIINRKSWKHLDLDIKTREKELYEMDK